MSKKEAQQYLEIKEKIAQVRAWNNHGKLNELRKQAQELLPALIRQNLNNLGLEDIAVTAVLKAEKNNEVLHKETEFLSRFCAQGQIGIAQENQIPFESRFFNLEIHEVGQGEIGFVDRHQRFHFTKTPTLEQAIGWLIATCGGQERLIHFFHLKGAANALRIVTENENPLNPSFHQNFLEILEEIFVKGYTSRLDTTPRATKEILWSIANREVFGEEREGFYY